MVEPKDLSGGLSDFVKIFLDGWYISFDGFILLSCPEAKHIEANGAAVSCLKSSICLWVMLNYNTCFLYQLVTLNQTKNNLPGKKYKNYFFC